MALSYLIFVLLAAVFEEVSCTDPCTTFFELPRAEYRGGNCPVVFEKEVCDRTLKHLWYKAVGLDGIALAIQTTPARFEYCGTKFPFWMNGTHPSVAEQEVNRTVCMTSNTNCDDIMNIMVKNCSGFYVYKLRSTDSCSKGYCFGETESCPPFTRSYVCGSQSGSCGVYDSTNWYAFDGGERFLNISSTYPSIPDACGSPSSLWIKNSSRLTNGSEENTVCLRNNTDRCGVTYKIISNLCENFYVYNFAGLPTKSCHHICTDDPAAICPLTRPSTTQLTTQYTRSTGGQNGQNGDENNASGILTKTTALIFYCPLIKLLFSMLV